MDWIKTNYDRFILALFAVALIAVGVMLFLSTQKFGDKFAEVMTSPSKSNKIPEVDTAKITEARKNFDQPLKWQTNNHSGLLFTSERYVVENGQLRKIGQGYLQHSRIEGPAGQIPNAWIVQYNLSPVDPAVGLQDPDGDGFLTEDEGVAKPPTDPTKKDSHPPYYTQLFLKSWITNTFQWQFKAYNGDLKTPEKMTFQINPNLGGVSEFLPIGAEIPRTGFKIKSFKFKEIENKSTGGMDDVSEVEIANPETGEELKLPLLKTVNSGQTGKFEYRWGKKSTEQGPPLTVPKGKDFVLQPEVNVKYKLLDGNPDKAVIQAPDGKEITVEPLNAPKK
jgi:hypothetical protein